MADTLNFGPEWLRVLSDGNSVGTPPPSPGIPGKYKLADYRYGREEMLALSNVDGVEVPEDLKNFTAIYVEKPLEPISLQNLTDEEQRLMSQSVNSTAVLRMHGRGAPPGVRGRGGIERGRGRGRGRGEGGFFQRGMSAEEGGGFGRPPTHSRSDGWEEVGPKRNFQTRYEEGSGPPQRQFHRSLSNENWRDRTGEEEEEDGDWRKAGNKWNTRTNWREPITRGGFDSDRHQPNGIQRGGFDRDKGRSYQRGRISESWDDEENLPEWSMPDTEGEDVGTFDASGAFVSTKKKPGDKDTDNKEDKKDNSKDKEEQKESDKNKSPDKVKVDTKEKVENKDKVKTPPPRVKKEEKQPTESESKENKKPDAKNYTVTSEPSKESKPPNIEKPSVNSSPKQENNSAIKNLTERNGKTNVSLKKEAAEAETLARLQEAAENVVLSAMTAEDEEKTVIPPAKETSTALPVDHEDAHKWFYKDPQGDMQGPFTSNEMAEWFSAGYFTMNLHVKRGCDEKISPLGELIKSWGRVPFLPGPAPPPALNTPTSQPDQQEQMKALQQLLVQQQLMQQQFLMRQLQMQQIQQVMQQLQDNEQFKNLPPVQQQQLAMQLMMKQSPVPVVPQTQMQNLSPRSPPNESVSPSNPSHPAFQRSVSQPNNTPKEEGPSIWDTNTQKQNTSAWSQPQSVWDIDPKVAITNTELEMQIEKARKEKEEQLERLRLEKEEEERRIQEELKRHQTEMMKQQEELMRQKEEMERQKQEIEKQRQLEMQRLEEIRRKGQEEEERKRREMEEQERRRKEEEMRREEEMMQKQEEAMRKKQEEDMSRRESELRQHQQRQMLEHQKQQQQELEERQKQQELQRRQEEARQQQELRQRQQQEALKKLQQEQMANMQLPQHAQWASQQASLEQQKAKSLLEIQEQEERERLKQEEIQRQLEAQRQQMMALQQQQQQQKSWSSQIFPSQSSSKSLIEIQEEQARQLQQERQRKQQQQQTQTKTMSISAASAWGGGNSSTHWASEGAWGNQARNMGNGAGSLGFWDDAIISSKRATPPNNKNVQGNPAEFPALKGGNQSNVPSVPVSKTQKPSKMKKEEEAVQRLFKQPQPQQNDFLQWCEKALRSLDTSVDIPTFIAFLTEVESPYEVHDYVRSYLGETKHSKDFAKQFLEKRSQSRNKAKPPVVEESIWGPAPARDYRQPTNQSTETDSQKSKGGKKKKKMMKIDSSILGFTVSADPERKNVGELEDDVK